MNMIRIAVITLLLVLAAAVGGCGSLPAERPLAATAVSVDVLDHEPASGKVRLALENHSGERLAYLWTHVRVADVPVAGQHTDGQADGDDVLVAAPIVDVPLGPGRRQIVEFDCAGDGLCRRTDVHVGIAVCRASADDCRDYEVIWSANTIAQSAPRRRSGN